MNNTNQLFSNIYLKIKEYRCKQALSEGAIRAIWQGPRVLGPGCTQSLKVKHDCNNKH